MTDSHDASTFERLKVALASRYILDRVLGRGGMATVYLAHDIRHGREVAIKVLRPDLAAAVGTDRFLKEIGISAKLAHPNIVPLHDSGVADGMIYYVMPYLTGETLRQVISRERQLGLDRALDITRAVAMALDYAHRQGVIHRDIKPENILLHEQQPMMLDFGIALALKEAGEERLTETVMSVGTPAYMSPEQVTGDRQPDARSDVYSLGCLLYEMLAGKPPFTANAMHALVARIVSEQATPLDRIRPGVPRYVEEAVQRALAKAPADRFDNAGAFASALAAGSTTAPIKRFGRRWIRAGGVAVAVIALAGIARILAGPSRSEHAALAQTTVRPLTSLPGFAGAVSWAPVGGQVAYMHSNNSSADLFVLAVGGVPRALSTHAADELTPRWSPDGKKIAFIADYGTGSALYWISPSGGTPRRVTDIGIPLLEKTMTAFLALGANPWSPSGKEIIVSRMDAKGGMSLWRVDIESGNVVRLTTPALGDDDMGAAWSFDGRRIAFSRMRGGIGRLVVIPAEGGNPTTVLHDSSSNLAPAWMRGDEDLVFMSSRSGALNLWQVHLRSGVLRRVTAAPTFDYLPSVSKETGEIAYTQFSHQTDIHRLNLADSSGTHPRITYQSFDNFGARTARDGQSFVYFSNRTGNFDVWRHDLQTGQELPLTTHRANDFVPDVSPDGNSVAFLSDRGGIYELWIMDREGRNPRRVTDHAIPLAGGGPVDVHFGGPRWSPDGRLIGYIAPTDAGLGLWVVAPDGSGRRATRLDGVLTFDWYLDSRRVVYTRAGVGGGVEMRAADLETGDEVVLFRGSVGEVTVAPSGDAVAHVLSPSHFTMDLHVLRLTRSSVSALPRAVGKPRQVTFGNGAWHVHNGSWSPDGGSLLYSRDTDRGNLFAVQIVRD